MNYNSQGYLSSISAGGATRYTITTLYHHGNEREAAAYRCYIRQQLIFISLMVFLVTGCSKPPDLGAGYKLYKDGKFMAVVDSQNTMKVYDILEYAFDSTFILASQRPWDSIPGFRNMNYKESNKAFEKSTFRQYWILNKKEKSTYSYDSVAKKAKYSNVYGPFKKEEYLRKREELKIPKELELKE